MSDIIVTVPKIFTHPCAPGKRGLAAWLAEGDRPGEPWSGVEWAFSTYGTVPAIAIGERVYVACEGRLVGYAPLVRIEIVRDQFKRGRGPIRFIRHGGAIAVTLPTPITGFRGWRYRWWDRSDEVAA